MRAREWSFLHHRIVVLGAALLFILSGGLLPAPIAAQVPGDYQVSGGLGGSFTSARHDGVGVGGALLLERAVAPGHWTAPQLYVGGFLSRADAGSCSNGDEPCAVSSRVAVAGAKVRVLAPIPVVAPFFEVGGGLSIGSVESRVGGDNSAVPLDEVRSGIMFHIPVSVGLAFGARRQHDLSFDYFAYPGLDHVAGTISVGVGFAVR